MSGKKEISKKEKQINKPTLGQLLNAQPALSRLMQHPLGVKAAYAVQKSVRIIGQELEAYEATRVKLCEKYGTLSEDKSHYDIAPESQAEFEREVAELQNMAVDAPLITLKLDALGDIKITPADMLALSWMVEE